MLATNRHPGECRDRLTKHKREALIASKNLLDPGFRRDDGRS